MIFHLVAVGRIRDAGLRATCDAYTNRLQRYIKFRIHEIPDTKGVRDRDELVRRESAAILKAVPGACRLVLLTRTGQTPDGSRGFAERLARWEEAARDIALVIGGAYGVGEPVQQQAEEQLSLSTLTLAHEHARLVLLEQLYRANTIRRGEPYHKGD